MCTVGVKLLHQYEAAEQAKEAIVSKRSPDLKASTKELLAAKQKYLESFANWLGHKAFCLDCKPGAPRSHASHI
jgi:hypothetical protein